MIDHNLKKGQNFSHAVDRRSGTQGCATNAINALIKIQIY
jgi:hypothetical protein